MSKLSSLFYTTGVVMLLSSCTGDYQNEELYSSLSESAPLKSVSANKKLDPTVVAVVDLLKKGEYKKASTAINSRLQDDPRNLSMHILNGVTYEKMAQTGESTFLDLAVVGYETALNLDPNNMMALKRLAQINYNKKDFAKAQELYANALLVKPDDPVLLQELAAASYYAYDLRTAAITSKKAAELRPDDVLAQRSASMVYAALGEFDVSEDYFQKYKGLAGEDADVKLVSSRINDWKNLYSSGRIHLAQADGYPAFSQPGSGTLGQDNEPKSSDLGTEVLDQSFTTSSGSGNDGAGAVDSGASTSIASGSDSSGGKTSPTSATNGTSAPNSNEATQNQIIIDCYLLRIEETAGTSKGNNILENLQVSLTPGGYLFGRTRVSGGALPSKKEVIGSNSNPDGSGVGTLSSATLAPVFTPVPAAMGSMISASSRGNVNYTSFQGGLNWSGLSYNLNIANVQDNRTEVIARPSLLTFVGHESVFFSGTELVVGLVGDNGGNLVSYPVGVTLVVKPTALDMQTGDVNLDISVEGAEFNEPNITADLTQTVNVGKTRVDTKAKLKLGQTLALGGIYERVETFQKTGVPGLSDVPIVQYLFSNEQSTTDRRSVVILMTPRSPDKTREDVERAMMADRMTPNLDEFENRNKDWFNTSPNLSKILSYISVDPVIYKEFRSADILPPSWGEPDNFFGDGWAMLASFLYY